jgi:hypothetical protein
VHLRVGMGFHRGITGKNSRCYWRLFPTKWH